MKRLFDLTFAILLLILFSPIIVVVAILVKITSKGPMFFIQERIGYKCHKIHVYKFRTMKVETSAQKGAFDAGDKSRITLLGTYLRKFKIDEIPQLLNVVKGEMSFVGPRPEVKKWVCEYYKQWEYVLTVKPGISDPASIMYRHEEEILEKQDDPVEYYRKVLLPHKLSIYKKYVEKSSFLKDLEIIIVTIIEVIKPGTSLVKKTMRKYY